MLLIRILVLLLLVALTLTDHPVPAQAQDDQISNTRYENLLNEYLREGTEDKRREEIAGVLRHGVLRDTVRKDLTRHVGKAETRTRALELAAALQVDRLYKKIQKELDGPSEAAAVKYIFVAQDPGSTEQLADRWEEKAHDTESFKLVNDGFMAHFVRVATLQKLYDSLKKKGLAPEKVEAGKRILRVQMNLKPDDAATDLEQAWKKFRSEDFEDTRAFPLEKDKLRMDWEDFWKTGKIRQCLGNYKLYPGATLELRRVPDQMQDMIVYVKCWMRVLSGNGAKFAMHTEKELPCPLVKDGRWVLSTTGASRPKSEVVPGKWEKINLYYLADRQTAEQYDRPQCVVTVENVLSFDVGKHDGKFQKIVITAGESTLVVGGLHFNFKE